MGGSFGFISVRQLKGSRKQSQPKQRDERTRQADRVTMGSKTSQIQMLSVHMLSKLTRASAPVHRMPVLRQLSNAMPYTITLTRKVNALRSCCCIHPKTSPFPICGFESSSIRCHKISARAWTSVLSAIYIYIPCPRSAKIDVGDDTLVPEVTADIAVRARKVGQRFAPCTRIRCACIADVCG